MPREFNLELDSSINEIIDEATGGNSFIALRKLRWSETGPFRLDIRKWYTNAQGEEIAGKGVSFISQEGPDNLIEALLKNGYGDTRKTLNGIKDRDDFLVAVKEIIVANNMDLDSVDISSIDQLDSSADYYDPKSIIL
jgi:hypothetical protein